MVLGRPARGADLTSAAGATGSHSLEAQGDSVYRQRGVMAGLAILGVIVAIALLYAADRAVQARIRARRLRRMSERLAAATVRAEEQQAKRQAADAASADLTSVMPAINLRLPAKLPDQTADGDTPRD